MSKILKEFEEGNQLPPIISSNLRNKIIATEIPIDDIKLEHTRRVRKHVHAEQRFPTPVAKHPLILSWTPELLNFTLFEDAIITKIRVWNRSSRPIYIQCCGLWNETSRLGASWLAYPRARHWLSPGLRVDMYVQATPRPYTPIQSSYSSLQIAATHLRDNVTGYFMVPINVTFLKYVPPPVCEGSSRLGLNGIVWQHKIQQLLLSIFSFSAQFCCCRESYEIFGSKQFELMEIATLQLDILQHEHNMNVKVLNIEIPIRFKGLNALQMLF